MTTTLFIIGLIAISLILFAVYRFVKADGQSKKLNEKRFEKVKPLFEMLENGKSITSEDIIPYAKNVQTRYSCFSLLQQYKKSDLFPQEYLSYASAAESSLVNWLKFPTELDAYPDEVEYIKRVTIDFDGKNNYIHYEVFKCKVNEPHWAAKGGWFLGVVGPYFDDSKPYDYPGATFSRITSKTDSISPEEEVKWVHENISLRRN